MIQSSMLDFLNTTPAGRAVQSYLKTFLAVILGLFLASGADIFSVSMEDAKVWFAAGLAAIIPLIITALNPSDTRFGQNAEGPEVGVDEDYDLEEEGVYEVPEEEVDED